MENAETESRARQTARFATRAAWLLAAACLLCSAAFLYAVDPMQSPLAPKCVFHAVTGWSCPGCGLQRAAHALLHGRFLEAAGYNPFLLLALPYLLALFWAELVLRGERRQKWRGVLESPRAVWLYLALYAAWGVARNILHI